MKKDTAHLIGRKKSLYQVNLVGKGGTDCLERGHGTVFCFAFTENPSESRFDRIGEFSDLHKFCADTQIQTDTDDADHSRNSPDEIVHGAVDGFNCLQHKISFLNDQ